MEFNLMKIPFEKVMKDEKSLRKALSDLNKAIEKPLEQANHDAELRMDKCGCGFAYKYNPPFEKVKKLIREIW